VADTKISALTAVTTPAAATELPVNEAGASKKITVAQLLTPSWVPGSVDGQIGYDTTKHVPEFYDSQRVRDIGTSGWCPFAMPFGFNQNGTYTTSLALAVNGGSVAVPFLVPGSMLLQSISFYNGTGTGTMEFQLYEEYLNNGNAGENTLVYVAGCGVASRSNTASAVQTVNVGTPGTFIGPGLYWGVFRNTHASTVFAMGSLAAGTMALAVCQTKTLGSTVVGANLDFVAATWTKVNSTAGARLNGRVFGGAAAF
jgi:hypothetical protein